MMNRHCQRKMINFLMSPFVINAKKTKLTDRETILFHVGRKIDSV